VACADGVSTITDLSLFCCKSSSIASRALDELFKGGQVFLSLFQPLMSRSFSDTILIGSPDPRVSVERRVLVFEILEGRPFVRSADDLNYSFDVLALLVGASRRSVSLLFRRAASDLRITPPFFPLC